MSLGLVVLEKKLFTRTRTPTPQSDDIKMDKKNNTKFTIAGFYQLCVVSLICLHLVKKTAQQIFKIIHDSHPYKVLNMKMC